MTDEKYRNELVGGSVNGFCLYCKSYDEGIQALIKINKILETINSELYNFEIGKNNNAIHKLRLSRDSMSTDPSAYELAVTAIDKLHEVENIFSSNFINSNNESPFCIY